MAKCPQCDGEGYWLRTGGNGQQIPCKKCNGSGVRGCGGEGYTLNADGEAVVCYETGCH